jgi:hypothetical protein
MHLLSPALVANQAPVSAKALLARVDEVIE